MSLTLLQVRKLSPWRYFVQILTGSEIKSIELLIGQLENMIEKAGTSLGQEFRELMCTYNGQFFSPTSNTNIRIFGFLLKFSVNFFAELSDKIHVMPTLDDVENYMKKELNLDWKCMTPFYEWTDWTNSYPLDKDGDDYEFLENHK